MTNQCIENILICQGIIDDYKDSMKEQDYIIVCNRLKCIYDKTRELQYQTSFIRDITNTPTSSAGCILFLLQTIKILIWWYSFVLFAIVVYKTI